MDKVGLALQALVSASIKGLVAGDFPMPGTALAATHSRDDVFGHRDDLIPRSLWWSEFANAKRKSAMKRTGCLAETEAAPQSTANG